MVVYFCMPLTNFTTTLHNFQLEHCSNSLTPTAPTPCTDFVSSTMFVRWCNCKIRMNRGHVIRILIFQFFNFPIPNRNAHCSPGCGWLPNALHTFRCWRRPTRSLSLSLFLSLLELIGAGISKAIGWKIFKCQAIPGRCCQRMLRRCSEHDTVRLDPRESTGCRQSASVSDSFNQKFLLKIFEPNHWVPML